MTRPFALFAVAALAFAPQVAFAQPPKNDATADLLAKLRKPVDIAGGDEIHLQELADFITERYGVTVMVNNGAFTAVGENTAEMMVKIAKVKGLPLAAAIRQSLGEKNATFLVRKGHIELVPIVTAAIEAKVAGADEGSVVRLPQPLVSAIYKEKPLNEALADLAEEYDLTIVVAPQAGDNKIGFVNARMLNVPADKAIELLALQADLRVIKKGNSFFVTGKDHANELFNEALEKQKQKLEVERQRNGPFGFQGLGGGLGGPPPVPPAPPAPAK